MIKIHNSAPPWPVGVIIIPPKIANMALRATPKVPKEALPVPIGAIPAQEFQTETGPMMAPTNKASLRI